MLSVVYVEYSVGCSMLSVWCTLSVAYVEYSVVGVVYVEYGVCGVQRMVGILHGGYGVGGYVVRWV